LIARRRPAAVAALVILAAAAAAASPRAAGTESQESGSGLQALVERIRGIRGGIESVRGLSFASEIRPAIITDEEARGRLTRLLRRDYPPAELAREERELRYFDLVAPGESLEALILGTLDGQVAGMYDPYERELFVVEGAAADDATLAHELAHALADQRFGLAKLLDAARRKDDEVLALSAMLEGEATLTTMAWMRKSAAAGAPSQDAVERGDASRWMGGLRSRIEGDSRYIGESIVFPYEAGTRWAAAWVRRGGFHALDRFFEDPPTSTEQILHPDKCAEPRDRPSLIDPGLLAAGDPAGEAGEFLGGSFGEFGVLVLLGGVSSASAVAAAQGWDGDLYRIEERPAGPLLIWVSVWDGEADAEEFLTAISEWLETRAAKDGTRAGGAWAARRSGKIVVVCEGAGSEPARRAGDVLDTLPRGIDIR